MSFSTEEMKQRIIYYQKQIEKWQQYIKEDQSMIEIFEKLLKDNNNVESTRDFRAE